jgi:26S proteasome regulatory subunit N5
MVISKRRGQQKIAITAIVEEAMKYIEEVPSESVKVALITTLKDICEGKIYVEAESAKLHLMLSQILEANGDIGGACDMIQDVHVETYGSLDKKEKAEYILHQIRINLKRKDYIRALIQSRKMNRKVFISIFPSLFLYSY